MIAQFITNKYYININYEKFSQELLNNRIVKETNNKNGKTVSFNRKEVDQYILNNMIRLYKVKNGDIYFISDDLINLKHFCYNRKRINKWLNKHDLYVIFETINNNTKLYLSKNKPPQKIYGQVLSIEDGLDTSKLCDNHIVNYHYEDKGFIMKF